MALLTHLSVLIQREYNERNLSLSLSLFLSGEHNSSHLVNAAPAVGYCSRKRDICLREIGKERRPKREDVAGLEVKLEFNKLGNVRSE